MCHGDTGLIVFTNTGPRLPPSPRFSTLHECRDFTAITNWVNDHDAERGEYVGTPED
jgi:hypothetical protein